MGAAFTGGIGAGVAAKGAGSGAAVSATGVAATGAAVCGRATGGAALAGRAALAARWVVVDVVADLVDLVVVVAGSAVRAVGSAVLVAAGSVTGVAGAWVTGCMASGAVWAIKAVEEKARTAAIADIAGRILAFLWVMPGTTNDRPLWVRIDVRFLPVRRGGGRSRLRGTKKAAPSLTRPLASPACSG